MTRLRKFSLSLAALVLLLGVQAATAKTPAAVKQTRSPITTLAMDGSRVAYASGGKVYVWNMSTRKTTLVQGKYNRHTAELAIAGRRVAWITRYVVGNSQQTTESLFTGSVGTRGRLLASGRHYLKDWENKLWYGRWIAGTVGSGSTLAVSTWWSKGDGTCTAERLSLVTPTGLRQIAKGPGAIKAASADGGHIAVLRSTEAWPQYGPTPAVTVGIYSTSGKLLREIAPRSADEVALSGKQVVVLTETKTLEVYDWTTGKLLHTWPVAVSTPNLHPGHLAVSGQLAVYSVDPKRSGPRKLHLVRLTTGKDVVLATAKGSGYWSRDAAMDARGLVYAVNYRDHGKLVFVPTVKLLAATAGQVKRLSSARPVPRTLATTNGKIYAFAQDSKAIGWIASDARARVRRVPTGKTWIVGKVNPPERAVGAVIALAGTRALWAWENGGNNLETALVSGAPGRTPTSVGGLAGGFRGFGDGERFSGIAGDGSTLAVGWADEECSLPFGCDTCDPLGTCPLYVVGGGVALVPTQPAGKRPPPIAGITPPALFALAQGRIAVAPASSPAPEGERGVPRVGTDGPVEVFDLGGRLLMRVQLAGIVRDVALAGHKLAVLLENPDGSKAILRYDARDGTYLGRSGLLPLGATDLASGTGGIVFRDGRQIFSLQGRTFRVIARAAGTPVGLSIEGRRVAWAENVGGHGRIRAITLGG